MDECRTGFGPVSFRPSSPANPSVCPPACTARGARARTKLMPSVSVIIPTHNRPRLLPRAVESAHAGGEDVEVVVVDDASTDETAEVCRELAGVKYIRR